MKKIGFWILTSLVMGNMVGSGIYLLPSSLASLGSITLGSWVITSIGSLFLALVFASLSQRFPKTGGPYVYCREGLGHFIGFQVAYSYWIYMGVGLAAIAVAFTGYLSAFFPILVTDRTLAFLSTISILWVITFINLIGVHFAGVFQLIITILKFLPLLLVTGIALFHFDPALLGSFNVSGQSSYMALSEGAMLTLWAFLGLESACIPADEVENPKRTIPRATIIGVSLAALIYLLSTLAIMGALPNETLRNATYPFALLAERFMGPFGKWLLAIGAMMSCIGTLNGWLLVQTQIGLAAAKDGLFPVSFSRLSKKRAPVFGLITSSILITLLLTMTIKQSLITQFTSIITVATLAAIFAYLYTTISEVVLQKRRAYKEISVALLAFIYVFWAITSTSHTLLYFGTLLLFLSLPIYAWMKRYEQKKNL
ncbi:MAG: amino acid permease [Simkaniaceae bacterium]|nr:amino acid permease [Simkaniaceae bacterium]